MFADTYALLRAATSKGLALMHLTSVPVSCGVAPLEGVAHGVASAPCAAGVSCSRRLALFYSYHERGCHQCCLSPASSAPLAEPLL